MVTGAGVVDETEITQPNFEIRHDDEVNEAYQ